MKTEEKHVKSTHQMEIKSRNLLRVMSLSDDPKWINETYEALLEFQQQLEWLN